MKKAIRYLRFSQLGQSNGSIERQEFYTDQWLKFNEIELVDTFIDRGKSARTFEVKAGYQVFLRDEKQKELD